MPKLNMTIPHSLTRFDALRRVQNQIDELKTHLGGHVEDLHEEWDGDTNRFRFSIRGFHVSGTLTVRDSSVDISGDLPFAALMFKGRIESLIRTQLETLLA
jgi:hypothetical protein